ncbi:RimK family alpha-L-glutamate ligase [Streptomyces sp. NPDC093109]|uniref:ATP-grasp domain-containing protein n=1 Tax=Streptomyces sp. NPDC093109 TaxID=3154977 RepID=UPI00344FB0A7
MARAELLAPADVWLLVREHPVPLQGSTRELAGALTARFGARFAVWHTDEFVFGVRDGRLVLRTLAGLDVPAPKVVCVRQIPGSMRHDREVTLLRQLERMGATLINPLEGQLVCRNKVWQLQELGLAGLPVPDTLSYATAPPEGVVRVAGLDAPCVVKSVSGYKGRQVFLAPDVRLLQDVSGALAQETPYLFQEYVAHSHGRDLRLIVVDGETVAAVVRTSRDGGLASNIAQGGSAVRCLGDHPRAEALAVRAARAVGLTVAGVDLLFTSPDGYTVCEVNAVPGWRPEMTAVAPAITACVARRLDAWKPAEDVTH